MKCFLSDMPELRLGLNDKLEDVTFHQCVNLSTYEAQKVGLAGRAALALAAPPALRAPEVAPHPAPGWQQHGVCDCVRVWGVGGWGGAVQQRAPAHPGRSFCGPAGPGAAPLTQRGAAAGGHLHPARRRV
jgi:hypothetical protein